VLTSHEEAEAEYALVVKIAARLIKKDAAVVVVRCCPRRCPSLLPSGARAPRGSAWPLAPAG
jgi:hypothetical protein